MSRLAIQDVPAQDPLSDLAGPGITTIRCRANDHIFLQGSPATAVFLVRSGQVRLAAVDHSGKLGIIGLARPGDFFGEACLTGVLQELHTASALTDTCVMRIERAQMVRLLDSDTALSSRFITHLIASNARLEKRLRDHLFSSSELRLAHVLIDLATDSDAGLRPIAPKPSHETLAALVGTTRPRISYFMKRFRERGFVDDDRRALEVRQSLLAAVPNDRAPLIEHDWHA